MAIYKRGNIWYVDVRYRYKGRSGRIRKKIGTRKRETEIAEAQIRAEMAAGTFVPPEERQAEEEAEKPRILLFKEFAEDEYLPWSEAEHSPSHYKQQRRIVLTHLATYFKGLYLHEITTKRIEDYKRQRRGAAIKVQTRKKAKKVKPATVNRELACIKALFRKAVEWDRLEESPAAKVRLFKELPAPPVLLEKREIQALLQATPQHLYALVATIVYSGLRQKELFYLRWEDIKHQTNQLEVVSRAERPTKNYQTRRIPLHPQLAEALLRHPRHLNSPYVFPNKDGRPYDNIYKALSTAAKKAGIPGGVRPHQLRHAFCSHALMDGVAPRTVQAWMGHKSLTTTLRYAHLSPEHEQQSMLQLVYNGGENGQDKAGYLAGS